MNTFYIKIYLFYAIMPGNVFAPLTFKFLQQGSYFYQDCSLLVLVFAKSGLLLSWLFWSNLKSIYWSVVQLSIGTSTTFEQTGGIHGVHAEYHTAPKWWHQSNWSEQVNIVLRGSYFLFHWSLTLKQSPGFDLSYPSEPNTLLLV